MSNLIDLRFRSATPAAPAAATPPATPSADPPVLTRNAPPANRTAADISTDRARIIGEAEALQVRSATLTADEVAQLDRLIEQAEGLDVELQNARRVERLAAQRRSLGTPSRPAPAPTIIVRSAAAGDDEAEAMRLWFRSFTDDADRSPDAAYRAAQGGFVIGSTSARVACDFGGSLNATKRRYLSKADNSNVMPKTYSAKLVEYISYFSPFLGLLDSETSDDGNSRDYFRIDDTSLMSSYITASSGNETNPTIPDKEITTGAVTINAFDITSGYHKLTRQAVRDSAVGLTDKVAKAIGNSHARRMEYDAINGTGDGSNGVQGILASGTRYGSAVDAFTAALFEEVYFSVPQQYRGQCIWLFSDTAMAKAVGVLKDSAGNSLFGKTIDQGAEIRTLHGRPCFTSEHMPAYAGSAKCVSFFNPMMYLLRLVAGQSIDVLREKFYPHIAYAGGMAFGGAWRGPAAANKFIQLDATPNNGNST
jgi:HK97 family phage major capsid protein